MSWGISQANIKSNKSKQFSISFTTSISIRSSTHTDGYYGSSSTKSLFISIDCNFYSGFFSNSNQIHYKRWNRLRTIFAPESFIEINTKSIMPQPKRYCQWFGWKKNIISYMIYDWDVKIKKNFKCSKMIFFFHWNNGQSNGLI